MHKGGQNVKVIDKCYVIDQYSFVKFLLFVRSNHVYRPFFKVYK